LKERSCKTKKQNTKYGTLCRSRCSSSTINGSSGNSCSSIRIDIIAVTSVVIVVVVIALEEVITVVAAVLIVKSGSGGSRSSSSNGSSTCSIR
jgi:hypothetical protein